MGNGWMVTKGLFAQELKTGRVVMGYFLGAAVMGYWMSNFLKYADACGEPINILETFCVVEQHYLNLLFLVLGWLLVVADAPFIRGNTYLLLYRCGRGTWNRGMLSYLLLQAFLYTAAMAGFTVAVSSFFGYMGTVWSSPVYSLAMDAANSIGVKYNVTFPWAAMMRGMSVPQAFATVFWFLYLYLVFLGVLLFVCNLLLPGGAGMVLTMGVHLVGYLRMMDGYVSMSLLARAVPGNFVEKAGGLLSSVALFVALIAVLAILSALLVKRVDFGAGAREKGADG